MTSTKNEVCCTEMCINGQVEEILHLKVHQFLMLCLHKLGKLHDYFISDVTQKMFPETECHLFKSSFV
jgi:hypothetical protein